MTKITLDDSMLESDDVVQCQKASSTCEILDDHLLPVMCGLLHEPPFKNYPETCISAISSNTKKVNKSVDVVFLKALLRYWATCVLQRFVVLRVQRYMDEKRQRNIEQRAVEDLSVDENDLDDPSPEQIDVASPPRKRLCFDKEVRPKEAHQGAQHSLDPQAHSIAESNISSSKILPMQHWLLTNMFQSPSLRVRRTACRIFILALENIISAPIDRPGINLSSFTFIGYWTPSHNCRVAALFQYAKTCLMTLLDEFLLDTSLYASSGHSIDGGDPSIQVMGVLSWLIFKSTVIIPFSSCSRTNESFSASDSKKKTLHKGNLNLDSCAKKIALEKPLVASVAQVLPLTSSTVDDWYANLIAVSRGKKRVLTAPPNATSSKTTLLVEVVDVTKTSPTGDVVDSGPTALSGKSIDVNIPKCRKATKSAKYEAKTAESMAQLKPVSKHGSQKLEIPLYNVEHFVAMGGLEWIVRSMVKLLHQLSKRKARTMHHGSENKADTSSEAFLFLHAEAFQYRILIFLDMFIKILSASDHLIFDKNSSSELKNSHQSAAKYLEECIFNRLWKCSSARGSVYLHTLLQPVQSVPLKFTLNDISPLAGLVCLLHAFSAGTAPGKCLHVSPSLSGSSAASSLSSQHPSGNLLAMSTTTTMTTTLNLLTGTVSTSRHVASSSRKAGRNASSPPLCCTMAVVRSYPHYFQHAKSMDKLLNTLSKYFDPVENHRDKSSHSTSFSGRGHRSDDSEPPRDRKRRRLAAEAVGAAVSRSISKGTFDSQSTLARLISRSAASLPLGTRGTVLSSLPYARRAGLIHDENSEEDDLDDEDEEDDDDDDHCDDDDDDDDRILEIDADEDEEAVLVDIEDIDEDLDEDEDQTVHDYDDNCSNEDPGDETEHDDDPGDENSAAEIGSESCSDNNHHGEEVESRCPEREEDTDQVVNIDVEAEETDSLDDEETRAVELQLIQQGDDKPTVNDVLENSGIMDMETDEEAEHYDQVYDLDSSEINADDQKRREATEHNHENSSSSESGADQEVIDSALMELLTGSSTQELIDKEISSSPNICPGMESAKKSVSAKYNQVIALVPSLDGEDKKIHYLKACLQILELLHPLHYVQSHKVHNHTSARGSSSFLLISSTAEKSLINTMCNIVSPPPKPCHLKIFLRRAPTQEEFFRGNLSRNPILISAINITGKTEDGAKVSDLRLHIANELQMTDSAELLELLVAGKIVGMNLSLKTLFNTVWKKHVIESSRHTSNPKDLPPMVVTYRLAGVDGEATEDILEELESSIESKVSSDEEESRFQVTDFFSEDSSRGSCGLAIILRAMVSDLHNNLRNIRRDSKLCKASSSELQYTYKTKNSSETDFLTSPPSPALILLRYAARRTVNRRKLVSLRAPSVLLRVLLEILSMVGYTSEGLPLANSVGSNVTADLLQDLIEVLASDINTSMEEDPDTSSLRNRRSSLADSIASSSDSVEGVVGDTTLPLLLSSLMGTTLTAPLQKVVADLLPYLTYGQVDSCKALAYQFTHLVDFMYLASNTFTPSKYPTTPLILMRTFLQSAMSLPAIPICDELRSQLVSEGFLANCTNFLLQNAPLSPPPWSPALFEKGCVPEEMAHEKWKVFLSRKNLNIGLKTLIGLSKKHTETQNILGQNSQLLEICHWLECTTFRDLDLELNAEDCASKDDAENNQADINELGLLSETLLDELSENDQILREKVRALRNRTKERKKQIAAERRNKALAVMSTSIFGAKTSKITEVHYNKCEDSISTALQVSPSKKSYMNETKTSTSLIFNEKGISEENTCNDPLPETSRPAWMMEMEELGDETGLTCAVCQEGLIFQPKELLGVYTFIKKVTIPPNKGGNRANIDGTTLLLSLPANLPLSLRNSDQYLLNIEEDLFLPAKAAAKVMQSIPKGSSSSSSNQLIPSIAASSLGSLGIGRNTSYVTTVTAGNPIHTSCHLKAKVADKNHPKAPKGTYVR